MDHLFSRLDGMYPIRWRSAFPNQDTIDNWMVTWSEAFEDEGIKPEMIRGGLKACRTKYDWPPSCGEFLKSCKPTIDPMVAYYQAVEGVAARNRGGVGTWSHPAIYWAAMPMAFDLSSQTFSQIKGRWEQALATQMDRGEWAEIPMPDPERAALPAPGKALLSRENANKMVEELGLKLQKTNHTLWYRNILDRHARGDKTLSMVQINFAKEAAKNHGIQTST